MISTMTSVRKAIEYLKSKSVNVEDYAENLTNFNSGCYGGDFTLEDGDKEIKRTIAIEDWRNKYKIISTIGYKHGR